MKQKFVHILAVLLIFSLAMPFSAMNPAEAAQINADTVEFTILHTNDFHGNLEPAGSNPGAARTAYKIEEVRTEVGADNVLLFDGGDIMQGSLISNLLRGVPTIDYYKTIGYNAAVFGNHEFDWGQSVLAKRALQAADDMGGTANTFPFLAANITTKVGDSCAGWDQAVLVDTDTSATYPIEPYTLFDVGPVGEEIQVGVIGVSSIETPYITIVEATQGLCFKDPAESILHYYDQMVADGADVIVVLSHNGLQDGGYGYGFPVNGDLTLAQLLINAGKPAHLIIGGHSHTDVATAYKVGDTTVVQAHHSGRKVGRADIVYDTTTHEVTITWTRITVSTSGTEYQPVKDLVTGYTSDPDYQNLINQEIGWTQVDLQRNYNGDGMMGAFIQDAIYNQLNTDTIAENDVDMVFNNPGGIRVDHCAVPGSCTAEGLLPDPFKLTYGMLFSVLPFGNETVVGDMTGAQILELLNQSATLFAGAIQVAGIRYEFYRYSDALPGPQPWAWGAYNATVYNKATDEWEPLDPARTYKIATNNFLAPAGQDGFSAFKYTTNITYWGDMLNMVIDWVEAAYPETDPYMGPDGDGMLDGRIARNGNDAGGDVIPLTVLHHNDSHGRLLPVGSNVGYSQLATIIKQERAKNPDRTLLLSAGDNLQGDSMMYYFKSAGLGYASDGTVLPAALQTNPLLKAFNAVGYDAMVLGNHEFNFGKEVFSTIADANFPILQANLEDTGAYGTGLIPVLPFVRRTVGPEAIKVSILGIGNHRVPNYELPSNIPGLTFSNPIDVAAEYAPDLKATSDVVIALTHIGFTTNPASIEVDDNVDTFLAAEVPGIDVVIGGHSHTNPSSQSGASGNYKYLPAFVAGPDGVPVLVGQANRYNTFLGQMVIGLLPNGKGAYDVVSRAGRAIAVTTSVAEDPAIHDIVQPYATLLTAYNNTVVGQTLTPIDTDPEAYTQETNGANLQADAAVWKLTEEGIEVDFHLSGAMTNRLIAASATPATPYTLTVADMFSAMPYENSLLVMQMNGPQLKAVLERAYRNYYYYKYVPDQGGYSYYTTCMIDIDSVGVITYDETSPRLPNGHNVRSLMVNGMEIDFSDAETYYNVSTVNYLAAGSCNFNDEGATLWPLDQIVADTQYYVRDAVIEYVQAQTEPINPQVEGRLQFIFMDHWFYAPIVGR